MNLGEFFYESRRIVPTADFDWNANDPWVISSVGEDNIVQVGPIIINYYIYVIQITIHNK